MLDTLRAVLSVLVVMVAIGGGAILLARSRDEHKAEAMDCDVALHAIVSVDGHGASRESVSWDEYERAVEYVANHACPNINGDG
jgi:hypothetical protein